MLDNSVVKTFVWKPMKSIDLSKSNFDNDKSFRGNIRSARRVFQLLLALFTGIIATNKWLMWIPHDAGLTKTPCTGRIFFPPGIEPAAHLVV